MVVDVPEAQPVWQVVPVVAVVGTTVPAEVAPPTKDSMVAQEDRLSAMAEAVVVGVAQALRAQREVPRLLVAATEVTASLPSLLVYLPLVVAEVEAARAVPREVVLAALEAAVTAEQAPPDRQPVLPTREPEAEVQEARWLAHRAAQAL